MRASPPAAKGGGGGGDLLAEDRAQLRGDTGAGVHVRFCR